MDLIREINEKYLALEAEVDTKLEQIKRDEIKFDKGNDVIMDNSQKSHSKKILTYEEAMKRNGNLLKVSLEMTKARLRSRSTFSPVEQILEKALHNYKMDLGFTQNLESIKRHHTATENIYDTVS